MWELLHKCGLSVLVNYDWWTQISYLSSQSSNSSSVVTSLDIQNLWISSIAPGLFLILAHSISAFSLNADCSAILFLRVSSALSSLVTSSMCCLSARIRALLRDTDFFFCIS